MRYEIINPSDQCFVTTDDDRIACVVGLLLGNGAYGMGDDADRVVLPIIFNGWRGWFAETFGEGIEPFMLANAGKIADCLSTFEYARERSSLNNIGAAAKGYEAWLRTIASAEETKP